MTKKTAYLPPSRFDTEKFCIVLYIDADGKFIQLNCPKDIDLDWEQEEALVTFLWREKYGPTFSNSIEVYAAENTSAGAIRKGNPLLSKEGWDWCQQLSDDGSGISVEDLWNIVLGLKWELGKPVPLDHPGWEWIRERYKDDDIEGSLLLIKRALRMEPLNKNRSTEQALISV